MAGRGRRGGHVRVRTAESGPAVDRDVGEGKAPQYLVDLLAPLVTGIEAYEHFMSTRGVAPPPEAPVTPVATDVAPATEYECWMRMIQRYLRLRAPEFLGGFDPLVADKWKEDVGNILSLMGDDPVQRHRLIAFSLR